MADITFEIKKHIGNLTNKEEGLWNTELNIISWNGGDPKFDIRPWSPDHKKCGKGITITAEEVKKFREILNSAKDEALYDKEGKIIF